MIDFYIRNGYVEDCKIIKFEHLLFLVKNDLSVTENSSLVFSTGDYKWINFMFEHTNLEGLIFKKDSIVLTKKDNADWNKVLAIFTYKFMNVIENPESSFKVLDKHKKIELDGKIIIDLTEMEEALVTKPKCIKSTLLMSSIKKEISDNLQQVLDEHGGKIEVLEINTICKTITFELQGSCSVCNSNTMVKYLKNLVSSLSSDYRAIFI